MSAQVLEKLWVNVTGKLSTPLSKSEAWDIIRQYMVQGPVSIEGEWIFETPDMEAQYQLPFRDVLIIGPAKDGGSPI